MMCAYDTDVCLYDSTMVWAYIFARLPCIKRDLIITYIKIMQENVEE